MQVVRDEPGQLLHLEETGSRFTRRRGKHLLCLSLLWTAPLLPLLAGWKGASEHPWMAGYALGFFYLIIGVITWSVFQSRETIRIVVDRAAGKWAFAEQAFGPLRERTREVPFDQVERACVRTAPWVERLAPDALAIEIALEPVGLKVALALDGVDRHEEVLDLAMRLGLAAGLGHLRLGEHTMRDFQAHLTRVPSEGSQPISPIDRPADYDDDESSAEGQVARPAAPPFDPNTWTGAWRIVVWAPGREVVLRSSSAYGALGGIFLLLLPFFLAGIVPIWSAIAEPGAKHRGVAFVVSVVWWIPLTLLLRAGIRWCMGGNVRIDWGTGRMRVWTGLAIHDVPLAEVRRVEVVGVHEVRSDTAKAPTNDFFSCRVVARHRELGALLLAQTEESRDAPEPAYQQGMSLGAALAKALGVPVKWKDYR